MPIDTVQRLIHIRTRKNQKVMRNLDRLWDISRQAESAQDILDALHPWGDYNGLRFYNVLPKSCIALGVFSLVLGGLILSFFPFSLMILISLLWFALAYLSYESQDPIDAVIDHLELIMKLFKYDLHLQKMPAHVLKAHNPTLILTQLKQMFPLFDQGNVSNHITHYASTQWSNPDQPAYSILLFKYVYVNEISVRDSDNNKYNLKKTAKELSGAFIFGTAALGYAASNRRSRMPAPYVHYWKTSDIELNQQLKIYGYDQYQIAKSMSPRMTVKLSELFQQHQGDLIHHHTEQVMCFVGQESIFSTTSQRNREKIDNISDLRGYLRTLSMPNYEKFKQSMLNFLA